jgi:ubiquinone/menaquinone biosynthesis C-methylase UbiE
VDCDRAAVRRRYDRLAGFIPLFDRPLFLPLNMRRRAVQHVRLRCGDRALEIGCGTGISLSYLPRAVGPDGSVYGVDLSPGMLHRAQARCTSQRNVELHECDAADFIAPPA